jgi:RecA/RadA recombinase
MESSIRNCKPYRSGAIDIVIVASVAALTPKKNEIEGEMGDSKWDFMHV